MKNNEPAFPEIYIQSICGVPITDYKPGMTLRDWFAGQALAGMTADPGIVGQPNEIVKTAYEYADAMLAERAKEE